MKNMTVSETYSKEHWADWPDVLEDLAAKFNDRSYVISKNEKINNIFRAVLAFDYIIKNFVKGAKILDLGCGIGYNSCFLSKKGYDVQAFDGSEVGIQRAKELAQKIGIDENIFTCCDHSYLEKIPDESIDAAIAMGFLYYLDEEARDYCYHHVHRILRKKGRFLLTCTNYLFDAFALNDTSIRFWAKMINDFSPAEQLFDSKTTSDVLSEKIKLPQRVLEAKSISRRFKILTDNPLTFYEDMQPYGYEVEDIVYPDCHLLPPAVEAEVDPAALLKLKAKHCIQQARDWRGAFMCYEFLAFMHKQKA